jgi:hypothetical protein
VSLSNGELAFLQKVNAAAMVTLRRDGTPHAVRIGVALVDGNLWSSGTQARLRTRLLRRDPRSTLILFEQGYGYLTLETNVTILEGADAPDLNVRLFRTMQKRPAPQPLSWFGGELDEVAFRAKMVEERRLIYQFDVRRSYGLI